MCARPPWDSFDHEHHANGIPVVTWSDFSKPKRDSRAARTPCVARAMSCCGFSVHHSPRPGPWRFAAVCDSVRLIYGLYVALLGFLGRASRAGGGWR